MQKFQVICRYVGLILCWCLSCIATVGAKTISNSTGHLKMLRWQEKIYLSENARRNVINFRARGEDLPFSSYITNWSYTIEDERLQKGTAKFTVEYARLNGKPAQYFNTESGIVIDVGRILNGKEVSIEFAYRLSGTKDKPYYRVEPVFFSGLQEGADTSYTVFLEDGLMLCSVPKYLHYTAPFTYSWSGKVTAGMTNQMLHITQPTGTWKITSWMQVKNIAVPTEFFSITTPKILNEGNQTVLQNRLLPSVQPTSYTTNGEMYDFKFKNLNNSALTLAIEATITNTRHTTPNKNYLPTQFTNISSTDRFLVEKAMQEIRAQHQLNTQNGQNYNLFTTIGEWVHNYITYDESQVGINTELRTIINSKRGVCEHYAILFTAICRAMGLPAFTVSGSAFDDENKQFVGHAWNFVYSNGRWYEVDPTWNLMSGVVPISHIIFQLSSNKTSHFSSTSSTPYEVELGRDIEYLSK